MQIVSLNLRKIQLIFILFLNIHGSFTQTPADSWFLFARTTNKMLDKCMRNNGESVTALWLCFKRNSLILFDEVSSADVIPLMDGVQLVHSSLQSNLVDGSEGALNGKQHKMMMEKYGNLNVNRTIWVDHILERTVEVLSTHKIRIDLTKMTGVARARHRFQVFPAMIFGMAVLGMITIPIGFHVMSIIGGKAFLFAVMALLIATMTSLKRLADFGSPYGVQSPHHFPAGYYERNDFK